MATGFTRAKATEILNSRLKGAYVALSTTTPDQDGNNFTEPDGAGYQRQQITHWNTMRQGQIANDHIVFLFEAIEDMGTVTHLGLARKDTVGSKVFLMAELTSPLTIGAGYVPLIRNRSLVIGLDKKTLESYPSY